MTVEYIDDGKRALFNDLVFVRDDKTGYPELAVRVMG